MQVFRIGARISWWHDFPTFLSVWIYSKRTSLTSWLWCIGNWCAQFIFICKDIKRYDISLWFLSMKCPEMQFWAWVHHQSQNTVSRVLKYPKKCLEKEIEFSWWCKNVLPDGLNWLCYFAGSSKSPLENSISFIFLESPHQVDMNNIVKFSKHFFGYFNTSETHCAQTWSM